MHLRLEFSRFENTYKKKNGNVFYANLYIQEIIDENGNKIFEGMIEDITKRKEDEDNLIRSKIKAEENDRLKTAFLQNISHEIRTPMNAIIGFSGLLVKNIDNRENLEKYAEHINQCSEDLLKIINDILDIAKIESGQLPVNSEECNINELFQELTDFFIAYQKRIGKEQLTFNLKANCDLSEVIIITDKIKLNQILTNLISNAFKFTDSGSIEGGCRFDENHNLIFYVSDTGIGIPSDKHDTIFERLIQLERGLNKTNGGTGLGLPIVKGLIDSLEGKLALVSEEGKGSTFSFTIPYKISIKNGTQKNF